MPKYKQISVSGELQKELAGEHHTCLCGDSLREWNGFFTGRSKVLLADLSDWENETPDCRMVFFKTKCGKCAGFVLHGQGCCDWRSTGEKIISEAAETVARRLEISAEQAEKLLKPSMKRFGIERH